MVTGSHNPADYNGFKLMLGKQVVLRRRTSSASARIAAEPARPPRRTGKVERAARSSTPMSRGCSRLRRHAAAHGRLGCRQRRHRRGAAAPDRRSCPASTCCSTRRSTARFPAHHPDPTEAEEPRPAAGGGGATAAAISASPSTATATASASSTARAASCGAISSWWCWPRRHPRASRRHDHRRRQGEPGAVRRDRAHGRHAADVAHRPFADQDARWPRPARRSPAR